MSIPKLETRIHCLEYSVDELIKAVGTLQELARKGTMNKKESFARRLYNTYWCLWDDFLVKAPLDRKGWKDLSPEQQQIMEIFAAEAERIFRENQNE